MAKKKETKEKEAVKKAVDKVGVRDSIQSTYAEGDIPLGSAVYTANEVDALTTLTEASGYTDWVCDPATLSNSSYVVGVVKSGTGWQFAIAPSSQPNSWFNVGSVIGNSESTYLDATVQGLPGGAARLTATRSALSGYQLGSQSSKPLQPAGDYALKSEVPVKAVKQNGVALAPDANGAVNVAGAYYAICTTSSSVKDKVASLVDSNAVFNLVSGVVVYVKFAYSAGGSSPTLSVAGTQAKSIFGSGDNRIENQSTHAWSAGDVVGFLYDGSVWRMLSPSVASTSSAGVVMLYGSLNPYIMGVASDSSLIYRIGTSIAPYWVQNSSTSYSAGDMVMHTEGKLYKAKVDIPANTAWNASNWEAVTVAGEIPDVPTLPLSTANGGTGVDGSYQSANKVLASPENGAGAVSFRALTAADIPNLSTEKLNAGTLGVARGGTGKSSHTVNSILAGNASSATGSVRNIATASGALYATSANGAASFGTLPIAQGGTGATTASGALTNLGALSTDGGTINGTLTVTGDLSNNGGFIETMGLTVNDYATGYVGTDSDFLLHIKTMPDASAQLPMGDVTIPRRTGTVALSSDITITELPLSDWTVTTTTSSSQWSELYLVAGTTGWMPYGRQLDICGDPKGDENSTSLSWTEGSDAAFNITATRSAGADWSITPSNVVLVFDNGMWVPQTVVELPLGVEKGTANSTRIEWDSNEANIDILAVRAPARYILGPDSADNPNRGKPFAKAGDYALKSELPDVADPSDSSPLRDGTASAGTMKTYARGDHRHPTDTTRIARTGDTSLTGNFKTTGTVTAGSLIAIGDVIVGEPTAYSNMAFAREGIISLKNDSATTLLAIPGGQQASDTNNTMPVLATTDYVPNKVKSQNGATFIQPGNDGTATILYIDPNATYGPPVITFSNDFSYGTMSSYAGTTVTMEGPYTVETVWTAWVKAGESAPTTISDLMSRDFVVASPNSTVGFMFFNEGVDFASIQDFESQSPTVRFYNSGVGSATMTRSISGSVVKTIATVDQIPAGYSIEHIPDGATQYVLQSKAITMVYVANITSNSLQLTLPDIDEDTILTFELWLTVPSGATGSISYLHDGASISPEAIGSLSLSTGFKNKLVLRLINDSGTYSLEENVYFQKGL